MISQLSCIEFCKFQIKSRKNFRKKGSIFQTQNERLQETTTDSSNEMEMQCERKKLQDVEISIIDNSRKKILRERERELTDLFLVMMAANFCLMKRF